MWIRAKSTPVAIAADESGDDLAAMVGVMNALTLTGAFYAVLAIAVWWVW